jgi:Mg2+/Co2+ transporter CorB
VIGATRAQRHRLGPPRAAPATTIAGLVIHEARSIPEAGQSFTFYGFRFEVLRRNRNRLEALRITPVTQKAAVKTG